MTVAGQGLTVLSAIDRLREAVAADNRAHDALCDAYTDEAVDAAEQAVRITTHKVNNAIGELLAVQGASEERTVEVELVMVQRLDDNKSAPFTLKANERIIKAEWFTGAVTVTIERTL